MNLAKEISSLLFKHNCVIIPDFGAFLLRDKKAEHNEIPKYALPKQRVISFNKQIINNDGLLANHIASVHNCTYEEGLVKIAEYKSELWKVLYAKRNVEVSEIGTFYYTKEDKLVFVPYHSVNFSTESYGLPKLRLKTININQQVSVPTPAAVGETKAKTIAENKTKPLPTRQVSIADKKAAAKTKQRSEQNQAKKLETKTSSAPRKKGISSLALVNVLGVCFIAVMLLGIIDFEKKQAQQNLGNIEIASLLDSPVTKKTEAPKLISYGIYATLESSTEGQQMVDDIIHKYADASYEINDDNTVNVYIISFSDEELAREYSILLQNKMNQKLVIKQK